jgi:hypothetical protein
MAKPNLLTWDKETLCWLQLPTCAVKRHNASVPFGANEGIFNNGKGRPAIATEETEGNDTKAVPYKSRI